MSVATRRTRTKTKSLREAAPTASRTVRRSFALPRHIVTEATAVAPAELQTNLNRLGHDRAGRVHGHPQTAGL